jgi:hypothetical protein
MVTCRGGNGVSERGETINKSELIKIVNGFWFIPSSEFHKPGFIQTAVKGQHGTDSSNEKL